MKIEYVTSDSEFSNLEPSWRELLRRSQSTNIFLTYDWLRLYWKYLRAGKALRIVTIREGSELVGVAPLAIEQKFGFRRLRFLGSPLSDYEDFILSGNIDQKLKQLNEVFQFLRQSADWDILHLQGIRESSNNFDAFDKFLKESRAYSDGLASHKACVSSIKLDGTFQDYEKRLKGKVLSDIRRCTRLIEKEGEIEYGNVESHGGQLSDLLLDHMNLHRARHSSLKSGSIFESEAVRDFFQEMVPLFANRGCLDFTYLRVGKELCASHLGFKERGTLSYYLPTFNEKFYRFSPARVLFLHLIRSSFEKGLSEIDLMLGSESYKQQFKPSDRTIYFFDFQNRGIRGSLGRVAFGSFGRVIKRMLGKDW